MLAPVRHARAAPLEASRWRQAVLPTRRLLSSTSGGPAPSADGERAAVYDAAQLERRFEGSQLKAWLRAAQVGIPLGAWFGCWVCVRLKDRLWGLPPPDELERRQHKFASALRRVIIFLGPAFIKVGQAMSSRGDVLPPAYIEELSKLQDRLPPFPHGHALIERELGRPVRELFAELSPEPVAAASLGQVYKGRLRTGEKVAVKVQRPGIEAQIALDLYVTRAIARRAASSRLLQGAGLDGAGMLDEFGARLFEELDYGREADSADAFYRLYAHANPIVVPAIHRRLSTRKVLTMQWVSGVKLTDTAALARGRLDLARLLNIGVRCSLQQLLQHGFLHCDPHPGNLLATPDGRLAYLDFGMMSVVPAGQRHGLISATVHLVNEDYGAFARDCVHLGFAAPGREAPLAAALRRAFGPRLAGSTMELTFTDISEQLSRVIYEERLRVPSSYVLIIRSLATLEGIALRTYADFKVLSRAYPFIVSRLLADPAPELRGALRDLLFHADGALRWSRVETLVAASLQAPAAAEPDDADPGDGAPAARAVEFFFSERATFLRAYVVAEVVQACDELLPMHYPEAPGAPGPAASLSEWAIRLVRLAGIVAQSRSGALGDRLAALRTLAAVAASARTYAVALDMLRDIAAGLRARLRARVL